MSEKVLYEVRFIETEDGIRIEMKGDKERWREKASEWRKRHEERQDWRAWKRWERRFRHPWFFGCGPWWDDEPEPAKKPESGSAADESAPRAV